MPGPRRRRRGARGALGVVAAALGAAVVFVASALAAVVLHLDLPVTRRVVVAQVNEILHAELVGEITIERVAALGLNGLSGGRVRVHDPAGVQVLFADGVDVRLSVLALARSALLGEGDVVVSPDSVSVAHVAASVDHDSEGTLRLVTAFEGRPSAPPEPVGAPARGVLLDAPAIALKHAWIHGLVPGAPPIDLEIGDVAARTRVGAALAAVDLDRAHLVARGLPPGLDSRGTFAIHVRAPSVTGKDVSLEVALDGAVAGVSTTAYGRLDGKTVDAVVGARDRDGAALRATLGEAATREAAALRAEVHGDLPELGGRAHLALGRASVDVDATVDMRHGTKAHARIAARHVDLHALAAGAPRSDIALDTSADVAISENGELRGNVALETSPSTALGEPLPIVRLRAEFTKDRAHATGTIVDPRATADFEASVAPVGKEHVVRAALRTEIGDLSRLPWLGASSKGRVSLVADGAANLGTKSFDARAHVAATGLAHRQVNVDQATVLATARGNLDRPVIDVGVHAAGVAVGARRIGSADVRGRIEPGAVTTLIDPHVDVVTEGVALSAYAVRAQLGGSRLLVEGATVTGLGEPILVDLSRAPDELHLRVAAPAVDLERVAAVVGRRGTVRHGNLALAGDFAMRRDGGVGELHAQVDALRGPELDGARMTLDAVLAGRAVGVEVRARMAGLGTFEVATQDVVLDGGALDAASWMRASGAVRFAANVDLSRLAGLVPRDTLPFTVVGGDVVAVGALRRATGDVAPAGEVHAATRGLVTSGASWRSDALDLSIDARVDPKSGDSELAVHATDRKGTFVALDTKARLPYAAMLAEPAEAVALLARAPVHAKLVVPERSASDFPRLVGSHGMSGTVEAEVDAVGTMMEPRVSVAVHGRALRSPSLSLASAADVDVGFDYDGERGDLVATVVSESRRLLGMSAHVDIASRDLFESREEGPAWRGSARLDLASFPLEAVAPLAARRVRGRVSGEAVLEDLHEDAKLHATIALERLRVGGAAFTSGRIVVDARDGKLDANARLDESDGYLALKAATGLVWREKLVPKLDRESELEAHLDAKAFRAAALLPFVQSQMNELDGRIDGRAAISFAPGSAQPEMEGLLTFREGRLQLVVLGEAFTDARATVTLQPGGVIKIGDVYMRGADGELTADGVLRTRGLAFDSAEARLHIPKRRKLDLALEGQAIGAVSGDLGLVATSRDDGRTIDVKVDVPELDLELPRAIKSGVQRLSGQENVRVGTFRGPHTFVKLPLDAEDLERPAEAEDNRAGTAMGIDVRVRRLTVAQGNRARVVLGGDPKIRVTDHAEVTGRITVKEGSINIQGKKFEVQKGTVTFQPDDTANPIVVATAEWVAEDGTRVYADFVGPVKTGKVTLRSDPPRPRDEILSMILFGTSDGANAGPPPPGRAPDGTTKAAASLGGGVAARGLNEAIDDLTGIQATARIDTSRANNPAPEIEVQIAQRISIAFAHILGTPPLSEPDRNLAIVEWRFQHKWSLETTVGDRGKVQTDAVWTKRY
jgi:translocation and assembly module TamB